MLLYAARGAAGAGALQVLLCEQSKYFCTRKASAFLRGEQVLLYAARGAAGAGALQVLLCEQSKCVGPGTPAAEATYADVC